jgi:hypothetical protein
VIYKTIQEALDATHENIEERKELAVRGPGNLLVAEVRDLGDGYQLGAVEVKSELDWSKLTNRHIVMRVDGRTCPVCGRTGEITGSVVVPMTASGNLMTGLDPENCVGCHDTMTTHGRAPRRYAADGRWRHTTTVETISEATKRWEVPPPRTLGTPHRAFRVCCRRQLEALRPATSTTPWGCRWRR